jgi:hypothetical protein
MARAGSFHSCLSLVILAAVSVLILVLVVAVAGAIAWLAYKAKQKRREALFVFASQHGLEYSRQDVWSLDRSYGFALFGKGDGRGCENVLTGRWEALPLREADYWYYDETSDGRGGHSRSYKYFSVIVADLTCALPHMSIERENVMTRLADHLGFHDIEFESEQFNRAFRVSSGDRAFAFRLIDARMMQWLLQAGEGFSFEVLGPNLLVSSPRRRPADLPPLLEVAAAFDTHIPELVRREDAIAAEPAAPDRTTGPIERSSS